MDTSSIENEELAREAALILPMTVAQCHKVIQAQAGCIDLLLQKLSDHEAQLAVLQERLKLKVLCDLVWKPAHANPGVTAPVVRIGLGGKCFSLAAIR